MRRGRGEIFEQVKRSGVILLKDLSLLASLYGARFLVWRILRRRRQADSVRRKNFRLVKGEGQVVSKAGVKTPAVSGELETLREARGGKANVMRLAASAKYSGD